MTISKNLREFVEKTVNDKLTEAELKHRDQANQIYEEIRDNLFDILREATEKCRKILISKGLNPEEFGYYNDRISPPSMGFVGYPPRSSGRHGYYYKIADDVIHDILLRIELDTIPKSEIIDYVNSYDVESIYEKATKND